jgi:hypothetical protein
MQVRTVRIFAFHTLDEQRETHENGGKYLTDKPVSLHTTVNIELLLVVAQHGVAYKAYRPIRDAL